VSALPGKGIAVAADIQLGEDNEVLGVFVGGQDYLGRTMRLGLPSTVPKPSTDAKTKAALKANSRGTSSSRASCSPSTTTDLSTLVPRLGCLRVTLKGGVIEAVGQPNLVRRSLVPAPGRESGALNRHAGRLSV
jgi:hypothetical protein